MNCLDPQNIRSRGTTPYTLQLVLHRTECNGESES